MPETDSWKGGYLIGLIPADDLFVIRWSKRSSATTMPGIWRLHNRVLFAGTRLLPIPKYPARLPQSTNQHSQGGSMATTRKASGKTPAKKGTKKAATKATNGASAEPKAKKAVGGRTRGPDKLEGLSDAKKRNIAKLIYRERSKSPATSWPDITEMIEAKYDWTLPGSMTGRRLLREHGPDNAEEAIIQQNREKKAASAKAATKTKKRAKKVVEPDEDEVEDDDEELEDEDDIEDEADQDEDDLDEDEDDEDEEEEEEPPAKAKKVRVTKGRGKKANPSK